MASWIVVRGVHNKPQASLERAAKPCRSAHLPRAALEPNRCMATSLQAWTPSDTRFVKDSFDEKFCRIIASAYMGLSHSFVYDSSFSEAKIDQSRTWLTRREIERTQRKYGTRGITQNPSPTKFRGTCVDYRKNFLHRFIH